MPFKDAEQRRAYNLAYKEQKREEKEEARIEMLRAVNETISMQNRFDINGLLLLDTNLRFYKHFSDYRRDHPNAEFPEFLEYQSNMKEWLLERKSERTRAVSRAIEYLTQFEPKTAHWRKMFPKFFKKYEEVDSHGV